MGRDAGGQKGWRREKEQGEEERGGGAEQQVLISGRPAEGTGGQRHQALRGQRFRLVWNLGTYLPIFQRKCSE